MSPEGKVRVVVRSRRVPTRIVDLSVPEFAPSGVRMGSKTHRVVLYDYILDGDQKKAVDEGRRLSCDLGLELEVVDRSQMGLLKRMLSSFGRNGSSYPMVVVSPSSIAAPSNPSSALTRGR